MIDYNAFHNYLVELVGLFQRTRLTKGMSKLAQKHHCTAITKDDFYKMNLNKMQPSQVTPDFSRVVRDTIGKSDAKAALRESIGALNDGILAGSRISQGSDRTVQITITQPIQPEVTITQPVGSPSPNKRVQEQPQRPVQQKPAYRVGQVAFHRGTVGWGLFLIDRVDYNSLGYHYTLVIDKDDKEILSVWSENDIGRSEALCEKSLRPAKGKEIARFLGALTRNGYIWEADNVNGTFAVKGKMVQRTEQVEVFANDLPNGYHGIYALPAYSPSPYRFALRCVCCVDNAELFMCHTSQPPVVQNAVLRQLEAIDNGQGCDGIREYLEYDLPTLCCSEGLREHRVAFVKVNNNGTSYWLARDRDVLRLLAWISFIV